MRTVYTILGSVVFILASGVAVEAGDLVAGPIPAPNFYDTVTCTAVNTSAADTETIQVRIFDDSTSTARQAVCESVDPDQSCAVSDFAYKIGRGTSPFHCSVTCDVSATPDVCTASLCVAYTTGGYVPHCLPALPRLVP
jgi:hypothetical protein